MAKRSRWYAIVLTLLALAIVCGVGTTFFTVELEGLVERTVTPRIMASPGVETMNREVYSGLDAFMASKHVRAIGYACFAGVVFLALAGLVAQKRQLAFLGSFGFILPIYAYFVLHMSFLAGLGVLTALWAPLWGDVVHLGDVAYVPYMVLVYPLSLFGVDVRQSVAGLFIFLGMLIFVLGVLAWFYARFQKKGMANFWVYRFARHPQYLGWILWSYGLMLRVALRHDTALHQANPGASLPWVLSTLIIICVALSEEIRMRHEQGEDYERYSNAAPFMVPLPAIGSRVISAPFKLVRGKERPETGLDLAWVLAIYLVVVCVLSLPFVVLGWPDCGGWAKWPF
jgi:protein-S-isoprenylcysteine O-methyltransferase Ste14